VDEFLTDEQRADQVRVWLRENGPFIIISVAVVLGSLFGWRKWQEYSHHRSELASTVYEQLMDAVTGQRIVTAQEKLQQLENDFAATPYADQGRLALARLQMDRNAFDEAADYLATVMDGGGDDEIRHVARLRLARLRIQQQRYADALDILQVPEGSAFEPRFHEVRGDAYHAMQRDDDARGEYQLALASGAPGVIDRAFVQAKLDDLSVAGPASAPEGDGAAPGSPPETDSGDNG